MHQFDHVLLATNDVILMCFTRDSPRCFHILNPFQVLPHDGIWHVCCASLEKPRKSHLCVAQLQICSLTSLAMKSSSLPLEFFGTTKIEINYINRPPPKTTKTNCYSIPKNRHFMTKDDELTYPPENGILKMMFLFPRWDMCSLDDEFLPFLPFETVGPMWLPLGDHRPIRPGGFHDLSQFPRAYGGG